MKIVFFVGLYFIAISVYASAVKNIDFRQEGEISYLEIKFDNSGYRAEKTHIEKDKQIILDIKNVTIAQKYLRPMDTSEFVGSVVFVSPYLPPETKNEVRFGIQLRENVRSTLQTYSDRLVLSIENRFGAFKEGEVVNQVPTGEPSFDEVFIGKVNIPKSDKLEDVLANLTLSGPKRYVGKRISINVNDIPVPEVLKMIADASGFNIILSEDIAKVSKISLTLNNLPWDQVLDTVLGISKLVAEKNGNILLVTTLQRATEDKKIQANAEELARDKEPLVTKIFPVSFASPEGLKKILEPYLTPERGKISDDARTNYLIIKDTAEVIEKMKKIVEAMDTQTPQILITAKIVEIREEHIKEIGLANGIGFGYDPVGAYSNGSRTPADVGPGFSFNSAANPTSDTVAGIFGGLTIGRFKRALNVGFNLKLMESESKLKIVSSPKVVAQNKVAADISTTDTTSYKKSVVSSGVTEESWESVSASMKLSVTPQVTNEGSIIMDINLTKESFDRTVAIGGRPPDKASNSIKTNVLVDNGSTIVLGGVYSFETGEGETGVPFLKDIPILGWLFKSAWNPSKKKNELMIFITPRIINQEEAGLVSEEGSGA